MDRFLHLLVLTSGSLRFQEWAEDFLFWKGLSISTSTSLHNDNAVSQPSPILTASPDRIAQCSYLEKKHRSDRNPSAHRILLSK